MRIAMLGIDLGKNSCSVVGLDAAGQVVVRRRMRRETVIAFAGKLPGCVVAMEACCGAHHLGRILAGQGHQVRLMSPEYVRPYVKAQKNDDRDAEAIAEAATRPTMRFVTLKGEEQLDMHPLILEARTIRRLTRTSRGSAKAEGAVGSRTHVAASDTDTNASFRTESQSFLTRARLKLKGLAPTSKAGARSAEIDGAFVAH
jgi:transposase